MLRERSVRLEDTLFNGGGGQGAGGHFWVRQRSDEGQAIVSAKVSRNLSLFSAIAAVALLRGSGFVGLLAGTRVPAALAVPYVAAGAALLFGYWGISRGVIIEPPAFIVDGISRLTERLAARAGHLAGQAS